MFKKLSPNGSIPAYTECPFKDQCSDTYSDMRRCNHKGEEHHPMPFSCGLARLFDMFTEEN